jgi:large subunit ribosomal protein L7A
VLDIIKNSKKTVGLKQSIKAIENGSAQIVYIAQDADEKIITNIKDLCAKGNVNVVYVENMKTLGKACGIDVDAAVVGILK